MTWWKEGPEEVGGRKSGIEALGIPCLSRYFGIECSICNLARKYYNQGDDEQGSRYYAKKTPLALAYFFSEHEKLSDWNNKLVVIALPIREVVGKIAEKLKDGDWEHDPVDLENGFVVITERTKEEGAQFPRWSVRKGKKLPVNKKKLLATYKELGIVAPKQDNIGSFLDWLYNKYPELVVVAGADFPYDSPVGLRLLPWPIVTPDGEYILESEADPNASPIKILRFHRAGTDDSFYALKGASFDKSKMVSSDFAEEAPDEDDVPF